MTEPEAIALEPRCVDCDGRIGPDRGRYVLEDETPPKFVCAPCGHDRIRQMTGLVWLRPAAPFYVKGDP